MISELSSSSWQLQKQQNYNNKKVWHEDTVRLGIDFILSHIDRRIKSSPFPLTVTTYRTSDKQIVVYNRSEMLDAYRQSLFIDCTVSSTSQSKREYYYTYRHDSNRDYDYRSSEPKRKDKPKIIFDIILIIDLHKADFETAAGHIKALDSLLQNMKEYLHGSNPTIFWTGNSFSIYQPIRAIFSLEQYVEILNYKPNPHYLAISSSFLSNSIGEFIARRIASYNSLYIPISTKPVLDIPGTLNSECIISRSGTDPEVEIVQKWNGWRPKIDSMLMIEFYLYLKDHLIDCNREGQVKEKLKQHCCRENGDISYSRYYNRSFHRKEATKQPNYKLMTQRNFLLCKLCYWCASSYSNTSHVIPISKCPSCNSNNLTLLTSVLNKEELL
jgi:hypothetical protein